MANNLKGIGMMLIIGWNVIMLIDVHKIVSMLPFTSKGGDCSVVEYSKPTWHGCRTNVQNNVIRYLHS